MEENIIKAPSPEVAKALEADVKKRVKKCYNRACLTLIIQMLISGAISSVITFVYAIVMAVKIMAVENITDPLAVTEKMMGSIDTVFILIVTVISYLFANVISYFIGNAAVKKQYNAQIFGRVQLKPSDCVLAVLSIIGVQMLSAIIQTVIITVTGMNGVSEETMQMMSFSDNTVQNIIIILYTVVIAAITEELLCRGVVLKALSPISQGFALVASALLFGIIHGNFNQMLNGFMLGLVIGYAAIKSKSIILPIILHIVANGHAMLWSFLEYKFVGKIEMLEAVYIYAMATVGIVAILLLISRLGMPNNETDGYPCTLPLWGADMLETKKGLTWKALLKTPCFWIFTVIYVIIAITSITAVA